MAVFANSGMRYRDALVYVPIYSAAARTGRAALSHRRQSLNQTRLFKIMEEFDQLTGYNSNIESWSSRERSGLVCDSDVTVMSQRGCEASLVCVGQGCSSASDHDVAAACRRRPSSTTSRYEFVAVVLIVLGRCTPVWLRSAHRRLAENCSEPLSGFVVSLTQPTGEKPQLVDTSTCSTLYSGL